MRISWTILLGALLLAAPGFAAPAIEGDYLEARTSDVYTGPCFANGEMNLAGQEAVMAWRVRRGAWEGVSLDGLAVVAVLRASATLGDPHADPHPVRSLLLVDEAAGADQRRALADLARSLSGGLLGDVVATEAAGIELEVTDTAGFARLTAGDEVEIATRALNHGDHLCGNEEVYYPPLARGAEAVPAVTLEHRFRGSELGVTWSSPNRRSAFVGAFAR